VPTSWDKPDIALRMVEAGVAVRLAPRRCTPQALRAAVEEVVGNSRYGENARTIARRLAAAPGPAGAADHIEALARTVPKPTEPATPPVAAEGGVR
jgi:UDP:flavonoid glycosyltransferase YjiC (YdhE family)